MSAQSPDHHDAELVLRLYEMRREPVMRESRDRMLREFLPRSFDELKAILSSLDHPLNRPWRQVSSYWEMAYGFARHGAVNAELLAENSGEGLFLLAKLMPYLAQVRAEISPTVLQNAEWLVNNSKTGAQRFELIKKRVAMMLEAAK